MLSILKRPVVDYSKKDVLAAFAILTGAENINYFYWFISSFSQWKYNFFFDIVHALIIYTCILSL